MSFFPFFSEGLLKNYFFSTLSNFFLFRHEGKQSLHRPFFGLLFGIPRCGVPCSLSPER